MSHRTSKRPRTHGDDATIAGLLIHIQQQPESNFALIESIFIEFAPGLVCTELYWPALLINLIADQEHIGTGDAWHLAMYLAREFHYPPMIRGLIELLSTKAAEKSGEHLIAHRLQALEKLRTAG